MITQELRRVLDGTSLAHLATVLPDDAPHSVPVWVGTHGDHIAILTGPAVARPATCAAIRGSRSP
ncbi:pyridoxamine 5'-phosphate oxidase family protein [Lentzea sp. NPDC005914]|uniref:pyridoxamine 5'-phosphate oxidase family protein n=1 Tax=Lentzea sp. NPDC005914 TaxID=3154572 RepID=UPI0033FB45F5